MSSRPGRLRVLYGAGPLHLLLVVACLALTGYVLRTMGLATLWNPDVWWQSILVWFLAAVILHDLVLFPAYALADRVLGAGLAVRRKHRSGRVSPLNYIRLPVLASGLILLLFFPGIIEQGAPAYLRATGQTQDPFLSRWLLLTAGMFGASALAYGIRVVTSAGNSPEDRANAADGRS